MATSRSIGGWPSWSGWTISSIGVQPTRAIRACRDPKDDKFLEAAVHGNADALITGDADLLALHAFHEIPILTPDRFLAGFAPPGPAGLLQEPPAHYRTRPRKTAASTAKA